jgi:sensor histidine kinase YesM
MERVLKLIKNRVSLHILFCAAIFCCIRYIDTLGFSITGLPRNNSAQNEYFGYAFILISIYLGRWVSKNYWFKDTPQREFYLFSLLFPVVIVTVWWTLIKLFFAPNAGFMELTIASGPFFIIAFFSGMLIKLVRTSISREIRIAKSATEQIKSELSILQSQLSPHFLFNTLNNLYGISLTQQEKIPSLLLKLSELLRYSVYDAKETFVPLKDEIIYINNYIQFEEIRIGERLELNNAIEENVDSDIRIAPMLLIIFIENAFKHAKDTTELKMFIDLTLKTYDDQIFFTCRNTHNKKNQASSITHKNSGFGLTSVTKRLELLYPGEYDLKIENNGFNYYVELKLKIK